MTHQFGIIDRNNHKEKFLDYAPERYDCVEVGDEDVKEWLDDLRDLPTFHDSYTRPASGLIYRRGITLIPPESLDRLWEVVAASGGAPELEEKIRRAKEERKDLIHFGIEEEGDPIIPLTRWNWVQVRILLPLMASCVAFVLQVFLSFLFGNVKWDMIKMSCTCVLIVSALFGPSITKQQFRTIFHEGGSDGFLSKLKKYPILLLSYGTIISISLMLLVDWTTYREQLMEWIKGLFS